MPHVDVERAKDENELPATKHAPSTSKNDATHLFTPVVLSILGTETAERFAYFGFRAVLVLYFKLDLYLDDNTAISCFAYTTCLVNFSPLFGALLADGPLGKFHTILCFGCLYAVGLMILTYAAFLSLDDDSDPYRAHGVEDSLRALWWKRALTCLGLICVCIGTGGIKPCVNIFGADQVALRDRSDNNNSPIHDPSPMKEHEEEEIIGRTATTQIDMELPISENDHAVRQFFNFFYFCINGGALTSFSLMPIVKRDFGFGVAFLLSTTCMTVALVLFYSRRNEYIYRTEDEEKPTLAATFQMCFQLMRRKSSSRHQLVSQQSDVDDDREDQQLTVLVERTSECHQEEDFQDEPLHFQPPRHSMLIHHKSNSWAQKQMAVDDAKQALKILPIMAMLPMFWMLYDQQGSVWTLQARRMALHGLEPEQMNLLNPLEIMLFIPLFDRIIYPAMENRKIDIAPLRRMGWGMLLASVSFVVSGFLEHVIESSNAESVSVFWTIPQITILAVGEIFLSITALEYAYLQSPDRLKGFIMATYLLAIATGDLLGGILYSSVFRNMNRATAMYVCAGFILLNRFVFGRVVATTQHGSTELNHSEGSYYSVLDSSDSNVDSNSSTDPNADAENKKQPAERSDSDGSIEMIEHGDEEDAFPCATKVDDDWLSIDTPQDSGVFT